MRRPLPLAASALALATAACTTAELRTTALPATAVAVPAAEAVPAIPGTLPKGVSAKDYADIGRLVTSTLPHPLVSSNADYAGMERQRLQAPSTPDPATRALIVNRHLGGVVLFGDDIRGDAQLTALDAGLRGLTRYGLLIATDQEGGTVRRVPTAQPVASAQALCATGALSVAGTMATAGRQLKARGVNVDLAPVADLDKPGGFLGTRAASPAPSACVAAAVEGLQRSISATAKHFPGLGGVAVSTDVRPVFGPRVTGQALQPFQAAVRAGVRLIMIDFARHAGLGNGRPAAFDPATYALLRGPKVGFTGVAVTDDLDAAAAAAIGTQAQTAVLAVRAGADLVLTDGGPVVAGAVIDALQAAVRTGVIAPARLTQALARMRALEVTASK